MGLKVVQAWHLSQLFTMSCSLVPSSDVFVCDSDIDQLSLLDQLKQEVLDHHGALPRLFLCIVLDHIIHTVNI
jgi:hypothetical protein